MSIEYVLQAFLADNNAGAKASSTTEIALTNASQIKLTLLENNFPLSTYRWEFDAQAVPGLLDLDIENSAKVLAVGLSMQHARILHSPVLLYTISAIELHRSGIHGDLSNRIILRPFDLEEHKILENWSRIAQFMKAPTNLHVLEALDNYWDALHSVMRRSRYLNLWASLEKASNHDGRSRNGSEFDKRVVAITKVDESKVCALRTLNNDLKHIARPAREATGNAVLVTGPDSAAVKALLDLTLSQFFGLSSPIEARQYLSTP